MDPPRLECTSGAAEPDRDGIPSTLWRFPALRQGDVADPPLSTLLDEVHNPSGALTRTGYNDLVPPGTLFGQHDVSNCSKPRRVTVRRARTHQRHLGLLPCDHL